MIGRPYILIVDNKSENIAAIEEMLSDLKVNFIRANSGEQAIELTEQYDFALAIVDIQIPGLRDFENVCRFRSEENLQFIPIIFLSSNLEEEYFEIEGVEEGSTTFISKPVSRQILRGKVNIFKNLYLQKQSIIKHAQFQADFLAKMSHEIRTPMNSILGMTDLLLTSGIGQEEREWLQVLKSAGKNLLSVIDEILDISKIESGQLILKEREFDLQAYLEESLEQFQPAAKQHQNEILLAVSAELPKTIIADPYRIWQIMINLVGNAIKFTRNGVINIECEKEIVDQKEFIKFSVVDSGCGMDKSVLTNIFHRFAKNRLNGPQKSGGVGLGMQISRELVELMNGEIDVESEVDIGTTFSFTIPLKTPSFTSQKQQTILLVDDEKAVLKYLNELLHQTYKLVTAANGKEAINVLTKQKIDIIISDIQMPVMNGVELVKYLYANKKDTPIIFLTAHRSIAVDQLLSQFEKIDLLEKPVDKRLLLTKLRRIKNRGTGTQLKVLENLPYLKILLVDDSKENLALIDAYFKKTPFELHTALNGMDAIERYNREKFDLIIMDTNMPIMDGNSATKRIRAIEKEKELPYTPIIALTAYATEDEKKASLEAGHDLYLTKPIKKNDLITKIIRITS